MTITKRRKNLIDYWYDSAEHDWKTTESLWRSKRYDACLFYCHLVLEKLLKGLIIQETDKEPPYIHDLVALLKKEDIKVDEEIIRRIAVFTGFNIRARYHKNKLAFYKLCTKEFCKPYFNEAKKLIIWLKKIYQKNK